MTQSFVSDYLREGILDYPGRRHDGNFISDSENIIAIPKNTPEAIEAIEQYLVEKELPSLSERIPVISYGANASPGAMTSKFDKYPTRGTSLTYAEMHTVPVLYGAITGSDVVWHGRPGQVGGYFAELYSGEETEAVEVQVAVEFLTPEQLAVMHTTEGSTYGVSSTKVKLADDFEIEGIFYGARDASILLDENGLPISVDGVKREGAAAQTMTPAQALEYTLTLDPVAQATGGKTVDEYLEEGSAISFAAKKARQLLVHDALVRDGKSRGFRHSALEEQDFGRANFSSMPRGVDGKSPHDTVVQLMEQSIERIRPSKEELQKRLEERRALRPNSSEQAHRRAVDPAEELRKQATAALLDPARAKALAKHFAKKATDENDTIKRKIG